MQIPLNTLYWYIGIPVMLLFAIQGLRQARRTKNRVTLLLGFSGLFFVVCLSFYGIPPLFTTNSQILTLTTILGDTMQFIALWVMWLVVARIYAPNQRWVRYLIAVVDLAVVMLGIYFSVTENLANPVTMVQQASGFWQINIAFEYPFQIVSAIQFLSLILVAAKFWFQSRDVKSHAQKLRLRAIAVGFFMIGAVFVASPFIGGTENSVSVGLVVVAAMVILGVFVAATIVLNRLEKKPTVSRG